jgi:hypothetical protein
MLLAVVSKTGIKTVPEKFSNLFLSFSFNCLCVKKKPSIAEIRPQ